MHRRRRPIKAQRWTASEIEDQDGRLAVITGANSGIGFEAARILAAKGATVVLACRDAARGEAAAARITASQPKGTAVFEALDLASLASVSAFAARMRDRYPALDLLINNAGVMVPPFTQTCDGFELQFGTNHLGHFALTAQLLPHMNVALGSRVVVLSSLASRFGTIDYEDPNYTTRPYKKMAAYCQSKLANLVFAESLALKLQAADSPIRCVAAHPGWTHTDLQRTATAARMVGPFIAMTPAQGALPTLYAATAPDARSGCFYGPDGFFELRGYPLGVKKKTRSNGGAFTDANQTRLWTLSEALVDQAFSL